MSAVITINHLCTELHDIKNWTLEKGEIHGIIGPSGEGKSCFLKIMLGLFPYKSGVILNEQGGKWDFLNESFGMLFQSNGLLNNLTIGENIIMPLVVKFGVDEKYAMAIAQKYMKQVGLDPVVYNYFPMQCSGGMQKRAALARALILEPKILFLDEPTAGLDCELLEAYDKMLLDLKARHNVSIAMVTHDVARLSKTADRVTILIGRKFYTGTLHELKNSSVPAVVQFLESYVRTNAINF